jgi:Domain of unknown function (DU1801)
MTVKQKSSSSTTLEEYLAQITPETRKEAVGKLRRAILENLPPVFEEGLHGGLLSYHVPKSVYPDGYHCDPDAPLPFISIAANKKNHIALYHMGLYADAALSQWFVSEYPKHCPTKLDMGKSCVRFKNLRSIPYGLVAELVRKMSVPDYITRYETTYKNKNKAVVATQKKK